jgi:hypothetical protein
MTHRRIPPRVSGQFVRLVVRGALIKNAGIFSQAEAHGDSKRTQYFRRVVDKALKDDPTLNEEVERLKVEGHEWSSCQATGYTG